ncbi:MAG: prolyl-tRNA synthetase associated domain-containing protein [Hespellia sp.]|nr:prolyl-tRNA synthetase associated domain-containing protein [Hespellia sp.]
MAVTKRDIFRLLDNQGISYKLAAHEAVYTIDELDMLELENADSIAKNLFVRDDKKRQYFLVVLNKKKRIDLKRLQAQRNTRRLSFASEADLDKFLGLTKGEVTPFGILNDLEHRVTVLVDSDFRGGEIGVHPNENTATVWLQINALFQLIKQFGNIVEWEEF